MCGTPLRPGGGSRVSTATTTIARATTTTVDAGSATTAMTTATVAGRRTKEVHRPWLEHPRREVPFAIPRFDQRAKVQRGHQPQHVARGLPALLPRWGSDVDG
jgi:hypothetical protein